MQKQIGAGTTVAVVITSHNYRAFILDTVRSALEQTRPADEILIIDDGSTDGSPDLVRQTFPDAPNLRIIETPNRGHASALKFALENVTSKIVFFLDSDDIWEPDHIEVMLPGFDRRDIDFVFCDLKVFGQREHHVKYHDGPLDLGITAVSTWLQPNWYGAPTSAIAMRTALARMCLDLPQHFVDMFRSGGDNPLVYGASVLGAAKVYRQTGTVRYRLHGNNDWGLDQTPSELFRSTLRIRALVDFYGTRMAFGPETWRWLKLEFKTKPVPTAADVESYANLALKTPQSWYKRRELSSSIRKWGSVLNQDNGKPRS